ncbi:DUF6634 family protein [Rhizobium sp. FKL33]|uniref:DUF6634 family protein n=1 Tax=Rhizobium sp. FKL33 TaxID=2562307 RepID=UPI0010BFCEE4|nr:DUF6634 family protein [Rhizobium sp. FKL33]
MNVSAAEFEYGPRRLQREDLAIRLEALAADLRGVGTKGFTLSTSFVDITDWSLAVRPTACLEGFVWDHPTVGTERVKTSELYYFDKKAGIARTLSRWYRLGQPYQPFNLDFDF